MSEATGIGDPTPKLHPTVERIGESFRYLSLNSRESLLKSVNHEFGTLAPQETALIGAMFSAKEANEFAERVTLSRMEPEGMRDLMTGPALELLINSMLDQPNRHRMALGLVLSTVGIDHFASHPRPQTETNATLQPSHETWYLCDTAERLLERSVEDDAVMALTSEGQDPNFLLKFNGKLTALCLSDTVTADGKVFLRGNWYSPIDKRTRDTFKKDFDNGIGKRDMGNGKWAFMKAYDSDPSQIEGVLNGAQEVAHNIPYTRSNMLTTDEGQTLKRIDYRTGYEEQERETQ